MHVYIHEENEGDLILDINFPPHFTTHRKYYETKTIWFHDEIVKRGIKILKMDIVEQLGELFTKGLPRTAFEYLRKKIMGW